MNGFAALLEALATAPDDAVRAVHLGRYLATTPDPERGWGLGLLAGTVALPRAGPRLVRALAAPVDPVLLGLSHRFAGDLAETLALLWPDPPAGARPPALGEVVAALGATAKADWQGLVAGWLDRCEVGGRRAVLQLATGRLPRVAAPVAWQALAGLRPGVAMGDVAAAWHGLAPPYRELLAWLEGKGPRPGAGGAPGFCPPMRARTADDAAWPGLGRLRAEWWWDGQRVQLAAGDRGSRMLDGDGVEIAAAPVAAPGFAGVLDGVLLAAPRDGVAVMVHDLLAAGAEDLRALPFDRRRVRLEAWFAGARPAGIGLSPLLAFDGPAGLRALHDRARAAGARGLMLKGCGSAYDPGGEGWLAWRRAPLVGAFALLHAERAGRGFASYTIGAWHDGRLVPVGRATAADMRPELDGWINAHTIARFGPVREVEPGLVVEVAFDAVLAAPRRKAGVVLREAQIVGLPVGQPACAWPLGRVVALASGVKGERMTWSR